MIDPLKLQPMDPLMDPDERFRRGRLEEYERLKNEHEKNMAEEEKKREEKLKTYRNAENHIYMHLMEAGDAGAIKDLTTALAIIRRIIREEGK